MKKLALVLFFLTLAGCTSREDLGNKIVLDINGDRWTAEDFSKELVFRLRNEDALMVKDPNHLAQTKEDIANDFIIHSLSAQWARKKGLLVKAEDLQKEIERVRGSYPDELSFKSALASQGLTFKQWRSRIDQTMTQKLVIEDLSKDLEAPSNSEIQEYYNKNKERFAKKEQVQIRHILLPLQRDAKLIETELKKGSSIEKLARILNSKAEGEALKPEVFWIEKGESPIFSTAFKMPIGRRSPVIKSEFGFHIFELLGKKYARGEPLKEVRDEIVKSIMERKQQDAYSRWMDEQIRMARIYKNTDLISNLRIETKEF